MTTRCEVRVLGQIAVTFAEGREPVTKFRTQKAALLLAYLALHAGKVHAREFLIELLWPGAEAAVGRNNLSTTLSILRRQLEPEGSKDLFRANHTTVQLNTEAAGVDAQRFEVLVNRGLHTRLELAERHAALSEALALWAPPLAGIYDDWALEEQARLEALADSAREALESLPTPPPTQEMLLAAVLVASSLPSTFSRFLGRELECSAVGERLTQTRLVTLLGPGGVGKTRLALEVARAQENHFERVVFASLAELPLPALIVPTLRRALTDAPPAPDPFAQLVAAINTTLGEVLIVLDNLEHLLPSDTTDDADEEKSRFGPARIVRQLLETCPNLVILATSRQPLRVEGEQQIAVEPLPPNLGRELFVDRARTIRADFVLNSGNQDDIGEICTLLDGLPLAIELAAAWVRMLSLKELRERLQSEVLWLEGRRRDLNPRQKSLEATLRWSWQLLSAQQKRLLSALAVFRGGWTLDAAEAITRSPETLETLYALVDQSLVLVDRSSPATRYHLLETIRQFANERLSESGEREVICGRHLSHYLQLAEAAEPHLTGPEQTLWLNRLEREQSNLRAALSWSTISHGNSVLGLRLAGALWRFWLVHGHFAEGREHLTRVLTRDTRDKTTDSVRAKTLHGAGVLARMQGNYAAARALHEESLAIKRELCDLQGIAMSLNNLGNLAQDQSDYVSACKLYEESLALKRELGDRQGISNSLNNLGGVAYYQGEHASSQALFGESLAIEQALGNPRGIARSLGNLGVVAYYQGDYVSAWALHWESLALKRQINDPRGIALCLEELAALSAITCAPLLASRLWGAVESLREEIASPQSPPAREKQMGQVTAARAMLNDPTAFDAAWTEGRTLPLAQAIALAQEYSLTNATR